MHGPQPATAKPYALRTYANGHEERLGREEGRRRRHSHMKGRGGRPEKKLSSGRPKPLLFFQGSKDRRPPSRIKARNLNEIISPPEWCGGETAAEESKVKV